MVFIYFPLIFLHLRTSLSALRMPLTVGEVAWTATAPPPPSPKENDQWGNYPKEEEKRTKLGRKKKRGKIK